jgi:hypothetical protein
MSAITFLLNVVLSAARKISHQGADVLWQRLLNPPVDIPVAIGEPQKSAIMAAVYTRALWSELSLQQKARCIVKRQWAPETTRVQQLGREVFLNDVFGGEDDFGHELLKIEYERSNQIWNFEHLTESDEKKAHALMSHGLAVTQRFRNLETNPPMNLYMARRVPGMCLLALPMAIKIPVRSLRYYIDVHVHYAFNSIRKSGHQYSDRLVGYLYELLFLQQKTAIAMLEFLYSAGFARQTKGEAVLINAETNAIMYADLIFTYLKSTIEKSVAILGYAHNIENLSEKKTHQAKLNALKAKLPSMVQGTPYGEFVLDLVSSSSLEDLNNFRTGILHKMGIADLQPHTYASIVSAEAPYRKLFNVFHEQHAKNTAAILGCFAMLTDELVRLEKFQ